MRGCGFPDTVPCWLARHHARHAWEVKPRALSFFAHRPGERHPKINMEIEKGMYDWLTDGGPAPGRPGVAPRWTSSKKDAVSTAYAASSKVWFTLSHGTLNEAYYPTIDRPQIRDMELLFSDGATFVHEEKRDFEYDFHYIDDDALAVRVVASDLQGRYTVTKEFIADPHHPVLLMNVKIAGYE